MSPFHPETEEMATYHGGCHCGAVQYTLSLPRLDLISVTECNCSICEINGYMNVYPLTKDIVYQSGQDDLGSYFFGPKKREHKFCRTCGTSLTIDFAKTSPTPSGLDLSIYSALNVSDSVLHTLGSFDRAADHAENSGKARTLKDIDLKKLKMDTFDGKHLF